QTRPMSHMSTSLRDSSFLGWFFFSSRRRHTRSKRDWSSDVCSSDLSLRVFEMAMTIRRPAQGVGVAFVDHPTYFRRTTRWGTEYRSDPSRKVELLSRKRESVRVGSD